MVTPGGLRMSVAMTNCGSLGWVSDRRGYRYDPLDPQTGRPWPPMPASFARLAARAAAHAGFSGFAPDACLVNRYEAGTRLSLHQDRNERDFDAPIVSVSLGIPATFLFGGDTRTERPVRVPCGMAMSSSGAAWTGCVSTASRRCGRPITRRWVRRASISRCARRVEARRRRVPLE